MDVSRISAVSPKQIDWRKLTASEIIKYDNQGIDVPAQYLQWAKDFREDLEANDKDNTTYEMATSSSNIKTSEDTSVPVDSSVESEDGDTTDAPQDEDEKTAAQTKREELQDAGVSLRNQAKIFTGDSKEASKAVLESASVISDTEEQSINEIQSLENYMAALLSKAEATQNDLKSEVANINNNKNDASAFGKINKLQQQLERYGNEGQTNLAASEADFSTFESAISGQSGVILNAEDFGTETIGVGNDLLTSIKGSYLFRLRDFIAGRRAIRAGEGAVTNSENTAAIQTQAISTNSDNASRVNSYKNDVQNTTGVAGISLSKDSDNNSSMEEKNETEKAAAAQNAGVQQADIAGANLDKVLQAKIKKGESLNA